MYRFQPSIICFFIFSDPTESDYVEPTKSEEPHAVEPVEKKKRGRKPKEPVADIPSEEVIDEEGIKISETVSAASSEAVKKTDNNNSSEPNLGAKPEEELKAITSPVEKRRRGRPAKSDNIPIQSNEHRNDKIVLGKTGRADKANKIEPSKVSDTKKNEDALVAEGLRKSSRHKGEPAKRYQELELTPEVDKRKGRKKAETSKVKASQEKTNSKAVKVDEKKRISKKKTDGYEMVAEEESEEEKNDGVRKQEIELKVGAKKHVPKKKDDITPVEEDGDSSQTEQQKKKEENLANEGKEESPVKNNRGRKKKELDPVVNQVNHTFYF